MMILVIGSMVLLAGVLAYWLHERQFEDTDDAFIDGHIVQVSPTKVSGYVDQLLITDNQLVHAGDLLLVIDPRDYRLAVEEARAAQATAEGKLQQADAQVAAAEAQAKAARADVAAAEATAQNASVDLLRNRNLAPRGAVSMQTLDNSQATASTSTAQASAAQQRAAAAESQYDLAKSERVTSVAQLDEARVQVRQAELNLAYTRILAPITGRVTNRTVDKGNYVQPGQSLFALVEPDVWVTANFKETQLTLMRVGQPVEVRVDAFPAHWLRAHVDSFQRGSGARFSLLPAENATGNYVKVVQRVPVKIVFDQPAPDYMILGPGMSVEPRVTVRGNP
jgi:membrane fusion protein (multidrug efflux system)